MEKKFNCILLIDDNDGDNEYHEYIIEQWNFAHKVHAVRNAEEAIDYLKDPNQITPDLIFLDLKMPRIDGWEFLEKYKTLEVYKKNIPIIILSASNNPEDVELAKKIDYVKGFKDKPLTNLTLTEILDLHF